MAHSLEVRAPLLDCSLVEWAATLPSSLKLRGREGKYIFRRAMGRFLPPEILHRRKQGFAEPLASQFRIGADRLRARLLGAPMQDSGLFRAPTIARLIDEHASGRFDHSQPLWLLLVFEDFLAREDGGQSHARPVSTEAEMAAA